ncbi:alpha/beta fold hydrolase [Algiphilus aromaticivorans]|uniref:alpha/beta fold hydrolase n=1 Tax=Algiphilus aromaticivorans TaxID=382454 RepID=UPI0005C1297B|nr:alpha/beta hydrolase [Algiphilus aromaticivorans]
MIGSRFDAFFYGRLAKKRREAQAQWPADMRMIDTSAGPMCVRDTGGDGPVVAFAVASPCVTTHYDGVLEALRSDYRVVVFDMPGFGFSPPMADYDHSLGAGGKAMAGLLETLALRDVTLVAGSINGLYGLAASQLSDRLARLMLVQTPSAQTMKAWFGRITQPILHRRLLGQFINFTSRDRFPPLWYRIVLSDPGLREAFTAPAMQALAQGACYCFASFVHGMRDIDPNDPLLSADPALPVDLVWGNADRTHRSTQPEAIQQHAPQAEILRVPEAGHYPDLEDPEAFARLLRSRVPPNPQ